jgi:hypothetical protein
MRCARFRFFVLHEAFFAKQSKEKSETQTVDIDLASLRSLEARLAVEYGHATGVCP